MGPALDIYFLKRMRRCFVVAHHFSGRRRTGDMQMFMEQLSVGKRVEIIVLSVELPSTAEGVT